MEVDEMGEVCFDRSVDEVRTVINHAKLEESDLKSTSQVLCFNTKLLGDDVKLIQVSKPLAAALEAGEPLTLRGEEEDGVVLCTKSKTYDLKEAETSNSMLILPELSLSKDVEAATGPRSLEWRTVSGVFYKYFEIQEIRPRIHRLRQELGVLSEDQVRDGSDAGVSTARLLDVIQASEEELTEGLKELQAVKFRGDWFVLNQDYKMKVLAYILRFFDDNSWPLDCVKKQETVDTLKDLVNQEILPQVFEMYCDPMTGGTEDEYSLSKDKVCRFFGDFILLPGSNFTVDEFLDMWQKAVPEGLTTDIGQLAGLVLIDRQSNPNKLRRFCDYDLPNNISDRLAVLFQTREKWSIEDITPYIQPLTTPKLNVNALLTKHAKPVNCNGVKYFCAKHGK